MEVGSGRTKEPGEKKKQMGKKAATAAANRARRSACRGGVDGGH